MMEQLDQNEQTGVRRMKHWKFREVFIILISTILLLVSITTAWMFEREIQQFRFVMIDYEDKNALRISSNQVNSSFWYLNETTGQYVQGLDDQIVQLKEIIPNDMLQFRLRFQNTTGESKPIALILTDISVVKTDESGNETAVSNEVIEEMLGNMYVGFKGGVGYVDSEDIDVVMPDEKFLCFTDEKYSTSTGTGKYTLKVYQNLIIPPTGETNYVELNGFLWLDRDAAYDNLSGLTFKMEHIKIIL